MYDKLTKWDLMTPAQTIEFRKLAKEFITNKWKSYTRLYANMANAYKQFWIPETLLPLSAIDQLTNVSQIDTTQGWWTNSDPLWIR